MSKTPMPSTPERNRLRAAAALIPIINAGLKNGTIADDRAWQMICFCEWAMSSEAVEQDEVDLQVEIQDGIGKLKTRMNAVLPEGGR